MKTTKQEKVLDFIETIYSGDVDFRYYLEGNEWDNTDDINELISDNSGFYFEVINYGSAIDYLRENDVSLSESIGLANEMGFDFSNVNSEVLASLLKSENERYEWDEVANEIQEFIDNL